LLRAFELNGVAIDANKRAFEWGRAAAHDVEAVKKAAGGEGRAAQVIEFKRASSLEEIVGRRVEFLTAYQDAAYAQRYKDLVERVRRVESDRLQSTKLAEAVARYYFKLLAIKDEYEVARLHSDPAFRQKIAAMFEGNYKLNFHLAPPLLAKADPLTGRPRKKRYGPWMMSAFGVLAKLRRLRGTAFDVFGRTEERRTERALVAEYEQLVDELGREVGLSRSALHERFVEMIGQPPMHYLANWRMQLGARLLREGNATVATVAQEVGYDSEAAFARAFKRLVGTPPAAWRRAQRLSG
jgi:indolepyruvate ferredoxin oxidoreductase